VRRLRLASSQARADLAAVEGVERPRPVQHRLLGGDSIAFGLSMPFALIVASSSALVSLVVRDAVLPTR